MFWNKKKNVKPGPEVEMDESKTLEQKVIDVLRTVYDPEIPVNIYELGLVYRIRIEPPDQDQLERSPNRRRRGHFRPNRMG